MLHSSRVSSKSPSHHCFMLLALKLWPFMLELLAGLQAQRHIQVTDAVLHKLAGVKDSEGEMKSCWPPSIAKYAERS